MLSFPFGDRSRYQSVTVVAYVGSHQIIDYSAYYSSLLAIYTLNTLHSHRGQFWGRAALAPVILNGSGRFYLRGKRFRRLKSRRNAAELATVLPLTKSMWTSLFWLRVALRCGRLLCDFMRAQASNWMNGFLYNHRVRVRKEDHGWFGCCGSERCEF
jgi:hypothetical protein